MKKRFAGLTLCLILFLNLAVPAQALDEHWQSRLISAGLAMPATRYIVYQYNGMEVDSRNGGVTMNYHAWQGMNDTDKARVVRNYTGKFATLQQQFGSDNASEMNQWLRVYTGWDDAGNLFYSRITQKKYPDLDAFYQPDKDVGVKWPAYHGAAPSRESASTAEYTKFRQLEEEQCALFNQGREVYLRLRELTSEQLAHAVTNLTYQVVDLMVSQGLSPLKVDVSMLPRELAMSVLELADQWTGTSGLLKDAVYGVKAMDSREVGQLLGNYQALIRKAESICWDCKSRIENMNGQMADLAQTSRQKDKAVADARQTALEERERTSIVIIDGINSHPFTANFAAVVEKHAPYGPTDLQPYWEAYKQQEWEYRGPHEEAITGPTGYVETLRRQFEGDPETGTSLNDLLPPWSMQEDFDAEYDRLLSEALSGKFWGSHQNIAKQYEKEFWGAANVTEYPAALRKTAQIMEGRIEQWEQQLQAYKSACNQALTDYRNNLRSQLPYLLGCTAMGDMKLTYQVPVKVKDPDTWETKSEIRTLTLDVNEGNQWYLENKQAWEEIANQYGKNALLNESSMEAELETLRGSIAADLAAMKQAEKKIKAAAPSMAEDQDRDSTALYTAARAYQEGIAALRTLRENLPPWIRDQKVGISGLGEPLLNTEVLDAAASGSQKVFEQAVDQALAEVQDYYDEELDLIEQIRDARQTMKVLAPTVLNTAELADMNRLLHKSILGYDEIEEALQINIEREVGDYNSAVSGNLLFPTEQLRLLVEDLSGNGWHMRLAKMKMGEIQKSRGELLRCQYAESMQYIYYGYANSEGVASGIHIPNRAGTSYYEMAKDCSYLAEAIRIFGETEVDGYLRELKNLHWTYEAVEGVTPGRTSLFSAGPDLTVAVGRTGTLYAAVTPESATFREIIWSSADPAVAKVDGRGNVQGVSPGTTTITAAALDSPDLNDPIACTFSVVVTERPMEEGEQFRTEILTAEERSGVVSFQGNLSYSGSEDAMRTMTAKLSLQQGGTTVQEETIPLVMMDGVSYPLAVEWTTDSPSDSPWTVVLDLLDEDGMTVGAGFPVTVTADRAVEPGTPEAPVLLALPAAEGVNIRWRAPEAGTPQPESYWIYRDGQYLEELPGTATSYLGEFGYSYTVVAQNQGIRSRSETVSPMTAMTMEAFLPVTVEREKGTITVKVQPAGGCTLPVTLVAASYDGNQRMTGVWIINKELMPNQETVWTMPDRPGETVKVFLLDTESNTPLRKAVDGQ